MKNTMNVKGYGNQFLLFFNSLIRDSFPGYVSYNLQNSSFRPKLKRFCTSTLSSLRGRKRTRYIRSKRWKRPKCHYQCITTASMPAIIETTRSIRRNGTWDDERSKFFNGLFIVIGSRVRWPCRFPQGAIQLPFLRVFAKNRSPSKLPSTGTKLAELPNSIYPTR